MASGLTTPETVVYLYVVTVGHLQRDVNGDLESANGAFPSADGAETSASCEKQVVYDSQKVTG